MTDKEPTQEQIKEDYWECWNCGKLNRNDFSSCWKCYKDKTKPRPFMMPEQIDQTKLGMTAFSAVEEVRKYMQTELERLNLVDHTDKVLRIKEMFDTLVQAYRDVKFQGGLD